MKITICKNGPYVVTGGVPLFKKTIAEDDRHLLVFHPDHQIATPDGPEGEYALCRCGKSAGKPFCDGAHADSGFNGTERADKKPFRERAAKLFGEGVDLLDDDRCAFARFCHRERGSVWEMVHGSGDVENYREAVEGASACPAGRLVAVSKDGDMIEDELPKQIVVIEDPQRGCSGGLYVSGRIPLEDAEGKPYETVNRYVLCRCGFSYLKPFCDAQHVVRRFRDQSE